MVCREILLSIFRLTVEQEGVIQAVSYTHLISNVADFVRKQCIFAEDFSELRQGFAVVMDRLLDNTILDVSADTIQISDLNVNSVMQRIAPEYVTVLSLIHI